MDDATPHYRDSTCRRVLIRARAEPLRLVASIRHIAARLGLDAARLWSCAKPGLQDWLRVVWNSGRPVLFLTGLCLAAALIFWPLASEVGAVFLVSGVGALLVFSHLTRHLEKSASAERR